MNGDQHGDVLGAYLSRLSLADLRAILRDAEQCHQAQMDAGVSTQLRRQDEMRKTVRAAVDGLIDYDKQIIERVISRAITGGL